METAAFLEQIKGRGWIAAPEIVPSAQVDRINAELAQAIDSCAGFRTKYGVGEANEGIAHHVPGMGGAFLEFIDTLPLQEPVEAFLGGRIIVNSFGGFSHSPRVSTYAGGIHRDIRSYFGETPMMLNMLVMLDEFTEDNGATYLLSGSHRLPEKPNEQTFFANAERAVGPRGTVVVFHSQLWHASGRNTSQRERGALTLTLTPSFYKQQVDYSRLVGYDKFASLSENQRQLIGYDSRVPASFDEWYQPPEKRMYKPGQG